MRINMPVTNVERHLKEGEYVVSKTDLKGQITYVNRPFIEISGFSAEELLGQPHNLIRHPDMPAAAYEDLWKTLKSGKPWRGMVKNRCKNGDYYWVEANANPFWKDGKIVGYMSLRSKPSRAQVEAAELIYRKFRDGGAQGLAVKEGAVVRTGLAGKLAGIAKASIKTRITIACLLIAAIMLRMCIAEPVLALAGVGLTGLIRYLAIRKILHPLDEAVRCCQMVASGNLRLDIATNFRNETGRLMHAIDTMARNAESIVADVSHAAAVIAASSIEASATAQSINSATTEQAASLEETASSVAQMASSINQNLENARVTDDTAQEASIQAAQGGVAVKETVIAMKSIAGKIGIIDDIAYQTNLLALNAAIEAARAGEYGKGFAVVAAEVRKLAERSQIAAKEIGELADGSVEKAEQAGRLFNQIEPSINKTSTLVQKISRASEEQSSAAAQINAAMSQLNQTTQHNASATEELAITSDEVSCQAEQLQQMMSFFRVNDHSGFAAKPALVSSVRPSVNSTVKSVRATAKPAFAAATQFEHK